MMQTREIQALCEEHQRRSDSAETDVIGLKKMLQELTQSSETEKRQIRYQLEEQLQTANSSCSAEVHELKAAKDAEIKALIDRSEKNRVVLENKIRLLEDVNSKINKEKMACENENERLATKLGFHETSNNTLANELSSVRSKLQQVLDDKASIEKSLHKLQLQLSSLEYSNNNKEMTISQTEENRISAEKVSADAKRTLSSQHLQMEDLRKALKEADLETSKYKDLTSRYQVNRLEMKKRLKEKAEVIREQEDVLVVKEKETSELKVQVRGLEEKLQRTKAEKDAASRELNDAVRQRTEDVKKLENNQQVRLVQALFSQRLSISAITYPPFFSLQVIAWLNKQLSNGGAAWQGGRTTTTTTAFPTPIAASRHLTVARTYPPQRSYVTPDIKDMAGIPQQLHPDPTPYSRIPGFPGSADMKM
jgi:hypothetical protein